MGNIIEEFYSAFQALDAERMCRCYHKDIQFSDPAFGNLEGERAKNIWRMLCSSQKDKGFELTFRDASCTASDGSAHWEAKYIFSKTGRPVHNKIDAQFKIKDGLIIEHTDDFNLHQWSKQAMGTSGMLLGWTGVFKKKLQAQTDALLKKYESTI